MNRSIPLKPFFRCLHSSAKHNTRRSGIRPWPISCFHFIVPALPTRLRWQNGPLAPSSGRPLLDRLFFCSTSKPPVKDTPALQIPFHPVGPTRNSVFTKVTLWEQVTFLVSRLRTPPPSQTPGCNGHGLALAAIVSLFCLHFLRVKERDGSAWKTQSC